MLPYYDFGIVEDCKDQSWCADLFPFSAAGKAVFAAKYTGTGMGFPSACAWGREQNFSFIQKGCVLNAFRVTCP